MKYNPKGVVTLKVTDDSTCVMYKTENAADLKKMEKFTANLMRHMAAEEQH